MRLPIEPCQAIALKSISYLEFASLTIRIVQIPISQDVDITVISRPFVCRRVIRTHATADPDEAPAAINFDRIATVQGLVVAGTVLDLAIFVVVVVLNEESERNGWKI